VVLLESVDFGSSTSMTLIRKSTCVLRSSTGSIDECSKYCVEKGSYWVNVCYRVR
jgi:hypothetical protein